jgi:aminoglycoside phosphotransferase (APT) family kinase protein
VPNGSRDLTRMTDGFRRWLDGRPPGPPVAVELTTHTGGGYSNEIFFADVTWSVEGDRRADRLVVRLPPSGPALFPSYDLGMQVAVQGAVAAHGVPTAEPVTLETDPAWLGSPFLVMPKIDGHDPGEAPAADPWLGTLEPGEQRRLHEGFLDVVARVHTTPWQGRPIERELRGIDGTLRNEIAWWQRLAEWAFDGDVPTVVADLLAWCRSHAPTQEPPCSVLWGDVRIGNVIFGDDLAPAAVLDWEMASIGPAELDLSWYTALEDMTAHFLGSRVAGFLERDAIVARHELALGRPLIDFEWFEAFALVRSSLLSIRTDRLTSLRLGKPPRPPERSAVLARTAEVIARMT